MNYYEHHIGDYAEATMHLTFMEDAAYSRLLRKYYATEAPLPADVKAVQRLVGARSKAEKDAVVTVLEEFFHLEGDGWHNDRCDEEIDAYRKGEPERELKKVNENNRMARHREERARLFQIITASGEHASWNTPMADLRALAQRISNDHATATATPATEPATGTVTPPATATATPATATHTPDTNTHTPDISIQPTSACAREAADDLADGIAMSADWRPSPAFDAVAKLAGLPAGSDPDGLGEFVAFWLTRPDERRSQAQWEHALVKSLQARKAQASRPTAAPAKGRGAQKSADRLPAWRVEEIRRVHQATPNLVDPELLHHIGIDRNTGRPFATPVAATVIDIAAEEIGHEPKRIAS